MFESDIDALVKETFNISLNEKGLSPFDDFVFGSAEANITQLNQVPGILYHLEKKTSTFVLRIFATENIAEDYKKITNNPDLYPQLRLENQEDNSIENCLCFFECDSLHLARKIKKELANKRFPIFEEHILNVSDPSDSWWIKIDKSELKIFFKLSRTESMDQLIKIGPIADTQSSVDIFSKLYGYFQMLFPVADYAIDHGQLAIKCQRDHDQIFKALKEIFLTGEADHDFWEYLRQLELKSAQKPYLDSLQKANLFLMELSTKRKFWKQIQQKLEL